MGAQAKPTWKLWPPTLAREDCATCHGTGWELQSTPGHAQARRCSCSALLMAIRAKLAGPIPEEYCDCTFQSFRPLNLSQMRAFTEARRFAERYPRVGKGLFFYGPPGTGKTHLAAAIIQELMRRFQDDVQFVEFGTMVDLSSGFGRSPGIERTIGRWVTASVLVLDDFGCASPDSKDLAAAERLLQARLSRGRPTICTGGRVRYRSLFQRDSGMSSKTDLFIRKLSPSFALQFVSAFKFVGVWGPDCRRRGAAEPPLFRSAS
jgi:DNA replication protein DnaC